MHVRIGDQSDPEFLQSLVDEFGEFDLVLDDGSHHVSHVNKTFQYLYPRIAKNGTYFIEDTHAAYWSSHGGSMDNPETINNVSKSMVDKINAEHTHGQIKPDFFTYETKCMSVYDSMVVFERGNVGAKRPEEYGGPKSNEVFIIKTH